MNKDFPVNQNFMFLLLYIQHNALFYHSEQNGCVLQILIFVGKEEICIVRFLFYVIKMFLFLAKFFIHAK